MNFALRVLFAAIFYTCLFTGYAAAKTEIFKGTCVKVFDGDTINVAVWQYDPESRKWDQEYRIVRLDGIDAPEMDQDGGQEAKDFLTKLIVNTRVEVRAIGKDWHGRIIGRVDWIENGLNNRLDTSLVMCAMGHAWWYRRFAPTAYSLRDCEEYAKTQRSGIWSKPSPVPPWTHRKQTDRVHTRYPSRGTVDS